MAQFPSHQPQHVPSPPNTAGLPFWTHGPYTTPLGGPATGQEPSISPGLQTSPGLDFNAFIQDKSLDTLAGTGHTEMHSHLSSLSHEMNAGIVGDASMQSLGQGQFLMAQTPSYIFPQQSQRPFAIQRAPRSGTTRGGRRSAQSQRKRGSQITAASNTARNRVAKKRDPEELQRRLVFHPSASEEEKALWSIRLKHEPEKNKRMWEAITEEFEPMCGPTQPARLQMKLHRAVLRYLQWPEQETACLEKAIKWYRDNEWKLILHKFIELGGREYWDFQVPHLKKKAGDLGYIEIDDETLKTKRRKRGNAHFNKSGICENDELLIQLSNDLMREDNDNPDDFMLPQNARKTGAALENLASVNNRHSNIMEKYESEQ